MNSIKFFLILLSTGIALGSEFKVKENSGMNKLERINSIETHIIDVDNTIKSLKDSLSKVTDSSEVTKLVEELQKNQKVIKTDIEGLRSGEIAQLKKDIQFVDQEKVEKLIEKFLKYQEDTEKRIKLLESSLKEINEQIKRVDSPIKN